MTSVASSVEGGNEAIETCLQALHSVCGSRSIPRQLNYHCGTPLLKLTFNYHHH